MNHATDPDEAIDDPAAHRQTHVVKTLWPGQAGTLKLRQRFGAKLVCVRYRHDSTGLQRFTTVEVIVDEAPVIGRRTNTRIYAVRVGRHELELQALIKAHGAKWNPQTKVCA